MYVVNCCSRVFCDTSCFIYSCYDTKIKHLSYKITNILIFLIVKKIKIEIPASTMFSFVQCFLIMCVSVVFKQCVFNYKLDSKLYFSDVFFQFLHINIWFSQNICLSFETNCEWKVISKIPYFDTLIFSIPEDNYNFLFSLENQMSKALKLDLSKLKNFLKFWKMFIHTSNINM